MTDLEFIELLETRPQNLLFADEERLFEFAGDEFNAADMRMHALSELVARWCLSPQ